MTDAKGNAGQHDEGSAGSLEGALGPLQKPLLAAGAAAAAGLLVGIFVGRATVDRTAEEIEAPPVARVQEQLTAASPAAVSEREEPRGPLPWYRAYFGRQLPKGTDGFERNREGRPSARLTGKVASVPFQVEARPGAYAIAAVLSLGGSKKGELKLQVDERPVGTIALNEGWQIYSTPLPAELLAKEPQELRLEMGGTSDGATLDIDSVAIVPVGSEVSIDMGAEAPGTLLDGFGKPAASYVWSSGERSALGVVLAPVAAKDYTLSVSASSLAQLDPLNITATVNGKPVGASVLHKRSSEATWLVPAAALRAGLNRVEFTYPTTLKPSELKPTSKDHRELAVRYTRLSLQPRP